MLKQLKKTFYRPIREKYQDNRLISVNARLLKEDKFALYNFWDIGPHKESWFYQFLQRPALRNLASRKSVGFYSVFGRRSIIRRSQPNCRVFFTGENLRCYPDHADYGGKDIDLALGFAHHSTHPNYLRFPLWIIDFFPPLGNLDDLKKRVAELDHSTTGFSSRENAGTLLARHDRNGDRSAIINALKDVLPITCAGGIYGTEPLAGDSGKIAFIKNYKFNICPENSDAPGYCTEKIFHAIQAGCIPIYWGTDNNPEPTILNHEPCLFFQPNNPQKLTTDVKKLLAEPEKLNRLAASDRFLPNAHREIFGFYTRLEEKMIELLS